MLMFILGQTVSTIGEEKTYNPRFSKSLDEFIELMNNLNLAYPKKIGWLQIYNILNSKYNQLSYFYSVCDIILFSDVALPINLKCGIQDELKNND